MLTIGGTELSNDALKLTARLSSLGVSNDMFEVILGDDEMTRVLVDFYQKTAEEAEKRADAIWRRELYLKPISVLDDVDPVIIQKLAPRYPKVYRLLVACESELLEDDVLTEDEVARLVDSLSKWGVATLRPEDERPIDWLIHLYEYFRYIPAHIREMYES